MTGAVTVRVNPAGVRAVLTSPGVRADLDARAARIRAVAGDGFIVRPRPLRVRRYAVQVRTDTYEARRAQAESNSLMRAVDAGRG